MKNLKIIIGIIITAFVAAFVGYVIWQRVKDPWNRDILDNEQLPYYRKDKQTVMKMLPKPASDYIDTIYVDSVYGFWPQYEYRGWLEEKGGDSMMVINVVDWDLDERKSRLQIIFVQEDSLWIANTACQWNPERIYF